MSIAATLAHPEELYHLYVLKKRHEKSRSVSVKDGDLGYCYIMLAKTSRSFAMVRIDTLIDRWKFEPYR